jgi:hypothetical protein
MPGEPVRHGLDLGELLEILSRIAIHEPPELLPEDETPLGRATREFFHNNWVNARDGLLARTKRLRVRPLEPFAPRSFRFELDCPYKRKLSPAAAVELVDGTLRGTITYRPDVFVAPMYEPSVAVLLDRSLGYFHSNFSRRHGILCLGDLPGGGAMGLDGLLLHIYMILTYQNLSPWHAADEEAAQYFALDPEAMAGLEDVQPLY